MHSAPSVSFPLGRSRFGLAIVLLLIMSGAAAQTAWMLQSQSLGFVHMLGCLIWSIGATLALRYWVNTQSGELAWTGANWIWTAQHASGEVSAKLVFDFQSILLLRLIFPEGASYWFWVQQNAAPARWLDLRRALVNRPYRAEVTS